MKKTDSRFLVLIALLWALTSVAPAVAHAQPLITQQQLADLEQQQPIDPSLLPIVGTFYMASDLLSPFPNVAWPCPPLGGSLPTYFLSDSNWFVVDNISDAAQQIISDTMTLSSLTPMLDDDSTDDPPPTPGPPPLDPSTSSNALWIEIVSASRASNSANIKIHGTVENQSYQVLSKEFITNSDWLPDGPMLLGAPGQNWTPATVLIGTRTNSLFLWCRSEIDADGNGLPDWWEMKYFGTNGVDPYAICPSGDGWSILQAYQNGWNPLSWQTPPPPQGLAVKLTGSGTAVAASWSASGGFVTGYTLERDDDWSTYTQFNLTNQTAYSDSYSPPNPARTYKIMAHYGVHGDSPWSDSVPVIPNDPGIEVAVVRGAQGRGYVVVSQLPQDIVTVRLTGYGWNSITNFDIPVASFTNGMAPLPLQVDAWDSSGLGSGFEWIMDALDAHGTIRAEQWYYYGFPLAPFFDGRSQLINNLSFLLRDPRDQPLDLVEIPAQYDYISPTNYAYAGLYDVWKDYNGSYFHNWLDEFLPFEDNYRYRNLVFSAADVDDTGFLTTGGYYDSYYDQFALSNPPTYEFPDQYTLTTIPDLLTPDQAQWTYNKPLDNLSSGDFTILGITNPPTGFYMKTGVTNCFGLPLLSAKLAYGPIGGLGFETLYAGGSIPNHDLGYFYAGTAQPVLKTTNYYFCQTGLRSVGLLPGDPKFSVTNTTPLLFASAGWPAFSFYFVGYAKQLILNGDLSKFAYLGQYFDKAYRADTNDGATTNQTGILSEYGEFLPTEPGLAILETKPDLTQTNNLQGQCLVHVISLALDANHDGTMDLSFPGPDTTSPSHPFVFWINNDNDGIGVGADITVMRGTPMDYQYGQIRSWRNLEDFARLWLCGLPKLPPSQGYTATLTMWSSGGSPAINLYAAYGTNTGTGYLTDTNVAAAQFTKEYLGDQLIFDYSKELGTISPNQSYNLPLNTDGTLRYTNFLFEGTGTGSGQLTLTISQTTAQGSNVLAQTSAWLDLHDVKDLYEQAHTANYDIAPPSTKVSTLVKDKTWPVDLSEDKQVIVFVHGLNTSQSGYYNDSETMFKRLYWQGFRGRFAAFRWPSPTWAFIPTGSDQVSYFEFNKGEYLSWHSAAALKAYIDDLRNRLPGYTINLAVHSLGNPAANEAIREGAQVDNYAMMQAAIGAGAFDGNNTNLIYSDLASTAYSSPDTDALGGYKNCFTNAARRVNFYNDDDYALAKGPGNAWEGNQLLFKPDASFSAPGWKYSFDGTNCFYLTTDHSGLAVSSRTLTEDFEKKAFVARSRTKAVGAAGLKYSPFALAGGVVSTNISLQDPSLGFVGGATFGNTRPEHSGEFTKPIQNAIPFYYYLLKQGFQLQPKLTP
jgi:hypothetical protein